MLIIWLDMVSILLHILSTGLDCLYSLSKTSVWLFSMYTACMHKRIAYMLYSISLPLYRYSYTRPDMMFVCLNTLSICVILLVICLDMTCIYVDMIHLSRHVINPFRQFIWSVHLECQSGSLDTRFGHLHYMSGHVDCLYVSIGAAYLSDTRQWKNHLPIPILGQLHISLSGSTVSRHLWVHLTMGHSKLSVPG